MLTLYVGNLPADVDAEGLRALFADHGAVTSATVVVDPATGHSRGFGFVEMEDAAARRAVDALDGIVLAGGMLRVNEARDRGRKAPRRPW